MPEIQDNKERELIEKAAEPNIVENPAEFHYSESTSFTRSLFKKSRDESAFAENGGKERKISDENEKAPFISGSSSFEDEPKLVLVTPEDRFNRVVRMAIALICMFCLFVFTTVLVLLDTESWTTEFFVATIASVAFINMCSAILQGGLFGFAGMLPPRYTQAVMGGQGLGGLFAALASILSRIGHSDIYRSAFGYFLTASVVLIVCLAGLYIVFKLEFVKHHISRKKYTCTCKCDSKMHDHMKNFVNEDAFENIQILNPSKESSKPQYFQIFKKIFPAAFSVTMIFLVTLACFPALTSRIASAAKKKSDWTDKYFVSVTCFLLFNLGDYLGRSLAGFIQIPRKRWPKWILPAITLGRLLFIPLFMFCNVQPRNIIVLFNHDAFPIIFMLLFAMTCGYFGSIAMMYGPSYVEGQQAELAGTIMACGLSIGLGLGSAFSFLVTSFI
eukprot:gene17474-19221_t